ncbi:Ubiquitin-conjugating enzyme E2 14 [Coemansia furcata]|uniref:Ubiquitin-conjugating enzyme E2 14 n=1 Tax=Coemansia furcata TaxID=417177 RepID=A0ACC1L821_9FUNG|nr:Ubiquitin-conjugating enzyme E2 14 [Coemansia furcata]
MAFPESYPYAPPTLTFETDIWHPNVYKDGRVCISILHTAGDDPHGYEDAEERWSPAQSVESIVISVVAMLSDPNPESPANIDAALEMRKEPKVFRRKARQCAERSAEQPCEG